MYFKRKAFLISNIKSSSRMAASLQQDSISFFQKLLRMFLNAFAVRPGIKQYDVPYAMTGVSVFILTGK